MSVNVRLRNPIKKFSAKLDLIRIFIDPPNGIPCGPQSQFMKFNNERNTKRLKTNFDSTIKTFYSKLKSFNRQE